jgi:hypothetical protein
MRIQIWIQFPKTMLIHADISKSVVATNLEIVDPVEYVAS